MIKQFSISEDHKTKLIRLKIKTGIKQYNILCRWAFCLSLAEDTRPKQATNEPDSNLSITWETFAGSYSDIYDALLTQRCQQEGYSIADDTQRLKCFKSHLNRGIEYLSAKKGIDDISDLLKLVSSV